MEAIMAKKTTTDRNVHNLDRARARNNYRQAVKAGSFVGPSVEQAKWLLRDLPRRGVLLRGVDWNCTDFTQAEFAQAVEWVKTSYGENYAEAGSKGLSGRVKPATFNVAGEEVASTSTVLTIARSMQVQHALTGVDFAAGGGRQVIAIIKSKAQKNKALTHRNAERLAGHLGEVATVDPDFAFEEEAAASSSRRRSASADDEPPRRGRRGRRAASSRPRAETLFNAVGDGEITAEQAALLWKRFSEDEE
jgi:hypothetical protein